MKYYTREECKQTLLQKCHIIKVDNKYKTSRTTSEAAKAKKNQPLWDSILIHTQKLPENCTISERVYWILYNINERPLCQKENCTNYVKFHKFMKGYLHHCSCTCSTLDKRVQQKIKNTRKEKYGDENYSLFGSNSYNQTMIKIYGVDNIRKTDQFKKQSKQSRLEKYGDENYTNRELAKITYAETYKRDHINIINKRKTTKKKNHNDENYTNLEKFKQTCIERFGVPYPMQNEKIKRKNRESYINNHIQNNGKFVNYSKISQELFWFIFIGLFKEIQEHTYFAELNKEFAKFDFISKLGFLYDFVITPIKLCIEFDGSYWHSKPEVLLKDAIKQHFLENLGFKIIRISEKEYRKNKKDIVNFCIQEIHKRLKEILKPL